MSPGAGHEAIPYDRKRPIAACSEVRMFLRRKPTITEKKIGATQVNQRRSHGLATPAARERIRATELSPTHPRPASVEGGGFQLSASLPGHQPAPGD